MDFDNCVNSFSEAIDEINKIEEQINEKKPSFEIIEKISNIQVFLSMISQQVETLNYNNFLDCIEYLKDYDVIKHVSSSENEEYFTIIGLENYFDKRYKGFICEAIDHRKLNEICFKCKKFIVNGKMENNKLEKYIDDILKENIKKEAISWKIISSYLYWKQEKTIAQVEILFKIENITGVN